MILDAMATADGGFCVACDNGEEALPPSELRERIAALEGIDESRPLGRVTSQESMELRAYRFLLRWQEIQERCPGVSTVLVRKEDARLVRDVPLDKKTRAAMRRK